MTALVIAATSSLSCRYSGLVSKLFLDEMHSGEQLSAFTTVLAFTQEHFHSPCMTYAKDHDTLSVPPATVLLQ